MFRKLFSKKNKLSKEEEQKLEDNWYEEKSQLLESYLGKEHDSVMHAIIPYFLGGTLDLYYYPHHITGTAIATKELTHACQKKPSNNKYNKYELVMFTKHALNLEQADDKNTAFGKAHQNIKAILNPIANYCEQTKLNPNETCEFPKDMEGIGGKCLLLSDYGSKKEGKEDFGLMVVMEIFRSEMEFVMQNDGNKLINLLKDKGIYPYSDMGRKAVV